jgi:hypothetical protein
MARLRISNAAKEILMNLYDRCARTVDDLPYTDEFEQLYTSFVARSGITMTRHDVWKALAGCRKQSRLVRKHRQHDGV